MIKYCNECLLSDKIKSICLLTNIPIELESDYCSQHKEQLLPCTICGRPMLSPGYYEYAPEGHLLHYCQSCHSLLNTCQVCSNVRHCEFETNPDPMPKVVMQTIRQGNAVMQMQVKNEERVKKFCHSCRCWMADGIDACGKEFNIGCVNQTI